MREAQPVWDEVYPYCDDRVLRTARRMKLGTTAPELAKLVRRGEFTRLVAALIRTELAQDSEEILKAAA